jgi:hypothetical protein
MYKLTAGAEAVGVDEIGGLVGSALGDAVGVALGDSTGSALSVASADGTSSAEAATDGAGLVEVEGAVLGCVIPQPDRSTPSPIARQARAVAWAERSIIEVIAFP